MKKHPIKLFTAILLILIITIGLSVDRMIIFFIAKINKVEISYAKFENRFYRQLYFKGLKIDYPETGLGIFAEKATISPLWSKGSFSGIPLDFSLSNVNFLKKLKEEAKTYDTLSALISAPFYSGWQYSQIKGEVTFTKNGLNIKELSAVSDDVKLHLSGIIRENNDIDLDITIYFFNTLTKKIPEELSNVALQEEGGGWKSLSVKLSGNYKMPSIQISNRLFRLNIRSK